MTCSRLSGVFCSPSSGARPPSLSGVSRRPVPCLGGLVTPWLPTAPCLPGAGKVGVCGSDSFLVVTWGLCSLASSYILRGSRNTTHNFVKCAELRHFNHDQLRSLFPLFFPLGLHLPAAEEAPGLGRNSLPLAAGGQKSKVKARAVASPAVSLPALRWPLLHTCHWVMKGFAEGVAGPWWHPRAELSLDACCHPLPLSLWNLHPLFLVSKTRGWFHLGR